VTELVGQTATTAVKWGGVRLGVLGYCAGVGLSLL
jgi:hypothetical protein